MQIALLRVLLPPLMPRIRMAMTRMESNRKFRLHQMRSSFPEFSSLLPSCYWTHSASRKGLFIGPVVSHSPPDCVSHHVVSAAIASFTEQIASDRSIWSPTLCWSWERNRVKILNGNNKWSRRREKYCGKRWWSLCQTARGKKRLQRDDSFTYDDRSSSRDSGVPGREWIQMKIMEWNWMPNPRIQKEEMKRREKFNQEWERMESLTSSLVILSCVNMKHHHHHHSHLHPFIPSSA